MFHGSVHRGGRLRHAHDLIDPLTRPVPVLQDALVFAEQWPELLNARTITCPLRPHLILECSHESAMLLGLVADPRSHAVKRSS